MNAGSRLNLLLTHRQPRRASYGGSAASSAEGQPWYLSVARLLAPLGVRTFEATTGPQALDVIEQHPIHLAVVDTRLPGTDALGVLRLIQRIRERTPATDAGSAPPPPARATPPESYRVQVRLRSPHGEAPQRVEVRFTGQANGPAPAGGVVPPTVILVTPDRNDQLLAEAMSLSAFSVVQEPIDLNLMLDVMARALRRFHHNLWPQ